MSAAANEDPGSSPLIEAQGDAEVVHQVLLIRQAKRVLGDTLATLPTQVTREAADRGQATENAWRDIDREFGLPSSAEVAHAVGKSGRSYASDRRKAGQLLAVRRGGHYSFPAFQLDESGPRPVIEQLALEAEHLQVREPSVLLWLATPSTWWDGLGSEAADRPVDHLDEPEQILDAFRSSFGVDW
ncbi:hypothetical protein AB0K08_02070 [Citricoccus sp. NPDC055426]|uniref:hypothetical protein n=1 Tax=Citricoccus sp. NPDC055426 TaxID=3155536 RepID=UPI00343CA3A0